MNGDDFNADPFGLANIRFTVLYCKIGKATNYKVPNSITNIIIFYLGTENVSRIFPQGFGTIASLLKICFNVGLSPTLWQYM